MSWHWKPYVPVAKRRANAARAVAKMAGKGRSVSPVNLAGRTIASTFWGKAWCDNLESYSDFSNRMPRGRTYVRNGSVVDLQIAEGKVTAMVCGSELYRIEVKIKPLSSAHWDRIQTDCAGKIDSLIELLQGRLSDGVMQIVTHRELGLFPKPAEISLKCSCPDWADMCKHVAASLYGVGARLDKQPELLFLLRGIDPAKLITQASAAQAVQQAFPVATATIADSDLAQVFGIELDTTPASPTETASKPPVRPKSKKKPGKPPRTKKARRTNPPARRPKSKK